jgi:hypothetical protein
MATAKFPGKTCAVCGREFIAGETEIEKHPSMHGPRGGAKWVHSNPSECSAHSNPRYMNAGRRQAKREWDAESKTWKHGPQKIDRKGKPRKAVYGAAQRFVATTAIAHYTNIPSPELVTMGQGGDANAIEELGRRERDPETGKKLAWAKKPKSNPFGYHF